MLRDEFVAKIPGGPGLIAEYYATAPAIVAALDEDPERRQVLDETYAVVSRCVRLVKRGAPEAALIAYIELVRGLQARYGVPSHSPAIHDGHIVA